MTTADDERSFRSWTQSGRPIGVMATIGCVIGIVTVGAFVPRLEGLTIFRQNDIPNELVTREGQKLCWTRILYKWRSPPVVDIDVDVDFLSNRTGKMAHQPAPALISGATLDEITSDDTPPAGQLLKTQTCLMLSRKILAGQPVRVRQTAYFESVTGLYNVPVTLPTIISPADQSWVFSKHDSAKTPADDAVAGPRPSVPSKRSDADTLDDVDKMMGQPAPPTRHMAVPLDDLLRDDDAAGGMVHMDTTLSPADAGRVKQSGDGHGDHSRRATLRRLIPRALDDEDRDALGGYDAGRR